jgi:hypothetical protein
MRALFDFPSTKIANKETLQKNIGTNMSFLPPFNTLQASIWMEVGESGKKNKNAG